MRIYTGATEERVHPTLQVVLNSTGVLYREERWEKVDDVRLSVP